MREKECFSYVVKDDCGYAPNPWGECTLAVCKPAIRKTAQKGDWILGITPRSLGFKAVYLMIVYDVMSLGEYYQDSRFAYKKPDFQSNDLIKWMGDNFNEQSSSGKYIQHLSAHNIEGRGLPKLKEKQIADLSGKNVLISKDYFYFGCNSRALSKELEFLRVGRFHRLNGLAGIRAIEKYASDLFKYPGVNATPRTLGKESKKLEYLTSA